MRPLRSRMQIVFQDPFASLNPRMSIRQIIEEGLVVNGIGANGRERVERVRQALQAAIDRGQRDPRLLTDAAALGRLVEPAEIGHGVAFLLSDDAAAITGINLPVDAGWLAGSHLTTYGGLRPAR